MDALTVPMPTTQKSASPRTHGPALPTLSGRFTGPAPALSWMVATALCFLGAGLAGVMRPVVDVPAWMTAPLAPPPENIAVEDITMADLAGEPAPADPSTPPDASPPAEPEASEIPPEPEPEPLLTEEDIVLIPEAPEIETALRPLNPPPPETVQPKPKPKPAATPATARRTVPASPQPPATAPGGTGTGGNNGTAQTASRGGKGKFPHPPYPSFAKSRNLSGTVTLSIRVSPEGSVISASVSGSSGSSELDNYAASWVTRRWKWPAGGARSFRLPVSFRLR